MNFILNVLGAMVIVFSCAFTVATLIHDGKWCLALIDTFLLIYVAISVIYMVVDRPTVEVVKKDG